MASSEIFLQQVGLFQICEQIWDACPSVKNSSVLLVKFTCEKGVFCIEQRFSSKGKMTLRHSWLSLKVSNPGTTAVESFH